MATMRDVAAAAGVSLKTVSRVVNGEPGVRPETAARVRAAVSILRFHPNTVARSLRAGHALPLLGLVIGDLANPFYSGIARGVEEVAAEHHHLVITGSSEERVVREHDLVTTLARQHVAGLLIVPAQADRGHAGGERESRIPTVFLDRPSPISQADAVLLDNRGGASRGVTHLIAQGHRRIGVVGDGQTLYTAGERLAGYHEALAAAGLPRDDSLLMLGAHDVSQAEACTRRLLERDVPPSAIFAMNNRACIGVLRAITARRSPVSVLGFDDLEMADLLAVPLALVVHDPVEMGRIAARLLFARLTGDPRPWQCVILPTTLIIRGRLGSQSG